MRTFVGVLSLVCLVVAIVSTVAWIQVTWQIDRDITGWQERAAVAGSAEEMTTDLQKVATGMQNWGMTQGQAAIVWKGPARDEQLIFGNVESYITWSQKTSALDHSSDAYVQNLHDIRTAVQGLDLHQYDFWLAHDGFGTYMLCLGGWILFLVLGLGWVLSSM